MPTKQWALLIDLISKYNPKLSFRILGTPTEQDICSDLHARIMLYSVENLCGKTNLIELSEILKSSKCLLCNDSGAMHLANALGVPVFAVFSSTSPEKTGPVFNSPVKIHKVENDNFWNFNSEDDQSLFNFTPPDYVDVIDDRVSAASVPAPVPASAPAPADTPVNNVTVP